MTPSDYLSYIDSLIVKVNRSIKVAKQWRDPTDVHDVELETLNDLRSKFLTIEYPQQETEPKEFTDGLE